MSFCHRLSKILQKYNVITHITTIPFAEKIYEITAKVNDILKELFIKQNIRVIDFKLEFGRYNGEILLADEISPDTCRLWDVNTNEKLDKDRFRKDLGDLVQGYEEVLARMNCK